MFRPVCQIPSSFSDSPLEVTVTGNQMKYSITLSDIVKSSGFEHWDIVSTQLIKKYNKGELELSFN